MDKDFILWLNKKLEKQRYDDLAQQYQNECEGGEYDYLNTEHLSEFLQKHFEIKYNEEG